MNAGKTNREITIQRKAIASDPEYVAPDATYGTENVVWVPLAYLPGSPQIAEKFWAEVQDVLPSRAEGQAENVVISRNPARIRLRWRNDVDSSMRVIVHGDTDVTYQIIGGPAEIMGRKRMIEIMCERLSS